MVTISGGPLTSDPEVRNQVLDDGSDKSMVLNGASPAKTQGRIVTTKDFSVQYHYSNNERDGSEGDELEMQQMVA